MKPYTVALPLLIMIALSFSGCDRGHENKKPNVILITIDTLRADHLGCYGYGKETTPTLDRLAREGVLFESAYTPSPRTTQALGALVTGRYPQTIGVRSLWKKLQKDEVTLAEVLKQHGYHTGGVNSNPILLKTHVNQGFDYFYIPSNSGMNLTAMQTNAWLLSWLKRTKNQPIFAWIHYVDPHISYQPPKEFRYRFDPDYQGRFKEGFGLWRPDKMMGTGTHEGLSRPEAIFNHKSIPQRDRKGILALYDGEIAFTDMAVGKLLEEMKTLGILENTLIIVSSDHGESFGEHQYFSEHGDFVYDVTVKVPLIFHWPGKIPSGRRIKENVRLIDVLPTVLSLLGIPDSFDGREGENIAPAILGEGSIGNLPVYLESGECLFPQFNSRRYIQGVKGKIRGLREENWKLILTPTHSKPIIELYNLDTDPSETQNLVEKEPERAREMVQRLNNWVKKGNNQILSPIEEEAKARLRALHYLH